MFIDSSVRSATCAHLGGISRIKTPHPKGSIPAIMSKVHQICPKSMDTPKICYREFQGEFLDPKIQTPEKCLVASLLQYHRVIYKLFVHHGLPQSPLLPHA